MTCHNLKMDVSIIIVNYNTLKLTKDILKSIEEKTRNIEYEIILIDNNSQDGSFEYFNQLKLNNFRYIYSDINFGFGKANNKGIEKSEGKYVFLLNSDTLLINNAIKILFDYMEKNIEVGVCGGNLYNLKMEPTHSFNKNLISLTKEFSIFSALKKIFLKKRSDYNYSNKPVAVGYITGADMFIRRKVLENVGIFDEDFFMYYEETELSARIIRKGYKIMNIPEAKIIHLEGASFIFKENREKMMLESRYKYYYKVWGQSRMKCAYHLFKYVNFIKFIITFNKDFLELTRINKLKYCEILEKIKQT